MKNAFLAVIAALALPSCGAISVAQLPAAAGVQIARSATSSWKVTTLASGWIDPIAIAFDGAGNAFVTDDDQSALFKVGPAGAVQKIASGLSNDTIVGVDTEDNVYVSYDGGLRKFAPNGTSSRFPIPCGAHAQAAGSRTAAYLIDGCKNLYRLWPSGHLTLLRKQLNLVSIDGMAVDGAGNCYINSAIGEGGEILEVRPSGRSSAFWLKSPGAIAVTASGNLYVVARDGTLSRVTRSGKLVTRATGLGFAAGIAFDAADNLYVASSNRSKVYRITPSGERSTFGLPAAVGVAVDAQSNLYVSGEQSATIVRRGTDGSTRTYRAGGEVNGIAVDRDENIYATVGRSVEKISPSGKVRTVASGFAAPTGVAVDAGGNIYVADLDTNVVKKITPAGVTKVVVSLTGATGPYYGVANGVAVSDDGTVYVAASPDSSSPSSYGTGGVYAVATDGSIRAISSDLTVPYNVAVDKSGSVYVTSFSAGGNYTAARGAVVRVDPAGNESCVTGRTPPQCSGTELLWSYGVAAAPNGDVYVARPGAGTLSKAAPR